MEGQETGWSKKRYHLNLRAQPSTKAKTLEKYKPGTLLYNIDGCMVGNDGLTWCNVQKIEGGARGYVVSDYIKPAIGPDGIVPTGFDNSAIRAGKEDFDEKGQIRCIKSSGESSTECSLGVARPAGGYATIVIKKPNGHIRAIFFSLGIPVGADTNGRESGDFRYNRKNGFNIIHIGDERYEIPDAVVLGNQ